ncbi:hypothetical protein ILYODFUR_035454 [Ilyodon furcidens]|uniref:Uncharacterized protein n=1 Tax=Ilyodon furcidens TaxID=33524 RepID=A0ABV0V8U2_9TELE
MEKHYPAQLYHRRSADSNAGDPTSKKRIQTPRPIGYSPSMPPSSPPPRSTPGHDSHQSSTPSSHERETFTSQVTGPGRPTIPGQAQPQQMLVFNIFNQIMIPLLPPSACVSLEVR